MERLARVVEALCKAWRRGVLVAFSWRGAFGLRWSFLGVPLLSRRRGIDFGEFSWHPDKGT